MNFQRPGAECPGLNVCVASKYLCESCDPQCDGTWRWSLEGQLGFGDVMRLGHTDCDYKNGHQRACSCDLPVPTESRSHVNTQLDTAVYNPGGEASQ